MSNVTYHQPHGTTPGQLKKRPCVASRARHLQGSTECTIQRGPFSLNIIPYMNTHTHICTRTHMCIHTGAHTNTHAGRSCINADRSEREECGETFGIQGLGQIGPSIHTSLSYLSRMKQNSFGNVYCPLASQIYCRKCVF